MGEAFVHRSGVRLSGRRLLERIPRSSALGRRLGMTTDGRLLPGLVALIQPRPPRSPLPRGSVSLGVTVGEWRPLQRTPTSGTDSSLVRPWQTARNDNRRPPPPWIGGPDPAETPTVAATQRQRLPRGDSGGIASSEPALLPPAEMESPTRIVGKAEQGHSANSHGRGSWSLIQTAERPSSKAEGRSRPTPVGRYAADYGISTRVLARGTYSFYHKCPRAESGLTGQLLA